MSSSKSQGRCWAGRCGADSAELRCLRSRVFRSTSVFSVSASSASAVGLVGVIGTRAGDRLAVGIDSTWAEEQESQGDNGSPISRGSRSILAFWS